MPKRKRTKRTTTTTTTTTTTLPKMTAIDRATDGTNTATNVIGDLAVDDYKLHSTSTDLKSSIDPNDPNRPHHSDQAHISQSQSQLQQQQPLAPAQRSTSPTQGGSTSTLPAPNTKRRAVVDAKTDSVNPPVPTGRKRRTTQRKKPSPSTGATLSAADPDHQAPSRLQAEHPHQPHPATSTSTSTASQQQPSPYPYPPPPARRCEDTDDHSLAYPPAPPAHYAPYVNGNGHIHAHSHAHGLAATHPGYRAGSTLHDAGEHMTYIPQYRSDVTDSQFCPLVSLVLSPTRPMLKHMPVVQHHASPHHPPPPHHGDYNMPGGTWRKFSAT